MRFSQPAGVTGVTYGAEWSATLLPDSWTAVPDTGTGNDHLFRLPAGHARGVHAAESGGAVEWDHSGINALPPGRQAWTMENLACCQ